MPNWCGYSMMVQGPYKSVKEFQDIMLKNEEVKYSVGHKGDGKRSVDMLLVGGSGTSGCRYDSVMHYQADRKHMFRIFDSYTPEDFPQVDENMVASQAIDGYCAWSVYCCMLPGQGSYYEDLGQLLYYGTNLVELSKELSLRIEVYGEEPNMSFEEHYVIEYGKLVVDETVDIEEHYDEETGTYTTEGGFEWYFDQFYDDRMPKPSVEFSEAMRPAVAFTQPTPVGKEPAVVFYDAKSFYDLQKS